MSARLIVFVVLAGFAFAGALRAEVLTPPAKAAIVLPQLRDFSPTDTSKKTVSPTMSKLLGNARMRSIHGSGGAMSEYFYQLDDNTIIHVTFMSGKLRTIMRERSARVIETFYTTAVSDDNK
jgi:hypothetical protein